MMPRRGAPSGRFKLGRRRLANKKRKARENEEGVGKRRRDEEPSARESIPAPPATEQPLRAKSEESHRTAHDAYAQLLSALPTSAKYSRLFKQRMRDADGLDEEESEDGDSGDSDNGNSVEISSEGSASESENDAAGSRSSTSGEEGDSVLSEADTLQDADILSNGAAPAAISLHRTASASVVLAEGDGDGDELPPHLSADPFIARYMQGDGETASPPTMQPLAMEPVPSFSLAPPGVGAGDIATALLLSAPAGFDTSFLAAVSADAVKRDAIRGLPLPPPHDLVGDSKVKARVAAAWLSTYGAETQALAVKHARMRARLAARAAKQQAATSHTGTAAAAQASAAAASAALKEQHPFTPLQHVLWPAVNSYTDVYFAARTPANARELRTLSVLHAVNHVVKVGSGARQPRLHRNQ
jgi:hypothetical protein